MVKPIIRCLCDGLLPSEVNVMRVHDRDNDDREKVHTRNSIKCGGSLLNMLRTLFMCTRIEDSTYMDSPIVINGDETEDWYLMMSQLQLPERRNDFDYLCVSRVCGTPLDW